MIKLLKILNFQRRSIFTMVFASSTMVSFVATKVFVSLIMVFAIFTMVFAVSTLVRIVLTAVFVTLTVVFVIPTMVFFFSTLIFGVEKMFSIFDHPFSEAEPILRTSEANFSIKEKTAGARRR